MTAAIQVIKFVNGEESDTAPGPHVTAGSTATFTYVVTDAGDTTYPRQLADISGDGRADIVGFGANGIWTAPSLT